MWFSFANYVHFTMTSNEFLFAGLFIQVLNSGFQNLAYCQGSAAELCEVILRWN